ncbi:unannotated protein [freshwater metagenome]|uniref:Unannotated protein n=1 Tax=freshwater metagenome TaxID=449393 RepID=A0A6J7U7M9_9ZZZZ
MAREIISKSVCGVRIAGDIEGIESKSESIPIDLSLSRALCAAESSAAPRHASAARDNSAISTPEISPRSKEYLSLFILYPASSSNAGSNPPTSMSIPKFLKSSLSRSNILSLVSAEPS